MKTILIILGIFLFSVSWADEGEQLFNTTCIACHTIGKGKLVGPDLLNISEKRNEEWLVSFIKSSSKMVNNGDADAIAVFEEYSKMLMPDNDFSDAQVLSILGYISQGGGSESGGEAVAAVDILSETTPENINIGLHLFSGNQHLENGGTACSSCHKVRDERLFSSGTLAKDLSETYDAMGSAGLAAVIKNPPFKVMSAAYKNHTLTDDEVLNLTAYLRSVSQNRIYQRPSDFSRAFGILGVLVFVIIFMSTIILYFKRKKLPVNHKILSRSSKVVN